MKLERVPYWIARFYCQGLSALLLRTRVVGLRHVPREGAVLLVSNHQSYMDPILATMDIPREGNYMARDSLFKNPLFGRMIAYLNAFPVRRNTADLAAIKESLRRLKQGKALLLFPEGTRTVDGRIQPMLPGLGAIAKKARVPIVPTLIDGVFQAWPRHRPFPGVGNVIVEYDRPISPAQFQSLTADELMNMIHGRLVAMQRRWHDRFPQRRLSWYGTAD